MKPFNDFRKELNEKAQDKNPPNEDLWKEWRKLVNMSQSELQNFYDSEDGKEAGMKKSDAKKAGINSGRESAEMLLKMIPTGGSFQSAEKNWTPTMWGWASDQVSFISRMRGMRKRMIGNPFERDGKKTRWYMSLLIWGHDPRKPMRKV